MVSRFCPLLALAFLAGSASASEPGRASVSGQESPAVGDRGLRFLWEGEPEGSPYREGSWVGMTYGSYIRGELGDNVRMSGVHAGVGYFFMDNVSFNLQVSGYYGDRLSNDEVPNEGTFYGASTEGIVRAHCLNYGGFSAFAEAGAGFSQWSRSVPVGGTHFNFLLTAGFGFTYQLGDCCHFLAGCRWFHLSNGNFFNDPNPGFDGKQYYAGFMFKH